MARKLAFSLELEGSEKLISNLTKVELELSSIGKELRQTKKDIDTFNNGTDEQKKALEESGKSLDSLENKYKSLRDSQLQLQAEGSRLRTDLRQQAKDFDRIKQGIPDDSLIGLRRRYEQLRKEINVLGKEARQLPENLKKIREAASVKKQIDDIGASVRDFRSNVGNYREGLAELLSTFGSGGAGSSLGIGAIVDPLSGLLGGGLGAGPLQAISGLTNALGPYGVAISAITAGTAALVGYVFDLTKEYEQQFDAVTSLAGVTGTDLLDATAELNALTKTYGQDFNETLLAANTIQKEFGISFVDSLGLIEKGLQQNADANGEYIDGLREYSTQAREAGLSAEQLNKVLIAQTQEGIFSDKGIDAVKEAGEQIGRLETKALSGLDRLGLNSTKIADDLSKGYKTTGDVIDLVATEIKKLPKDSITARKAIDEIFGTPGIDAGRRFIETLSELGDESEEVEQQLTPYQERLARIKDANLELEQENVKLAATFAGIGFELDTVTTRLKTFGTRLLNNVIETFEVNKRIIEEDGFFGALRGGQERFAEEQKEFIKDNANALSSLTKGQAEEAENLREQAKQGLLSLKELRQEQQKIKDEIDSARASGTDFTALQDDLIQVNKRVTEATKALNVNIKSAKENFKAIAEEGSIEQLTKKVSDLQKQINQASPNKALELIDDLNAAKLDLSQAKQELDAFEQQLKETNVNSLPIEEQVKVYKEQIERRRQLDIQYAQEKISNERILTEKLSKINLESDIKSLNEDLKLLKENSSEYVQTLNEINSKKEEIEDIDIRIQLIESEETITEARLIRERLLREAFTDEEQLQARLKLLRTNTDIASIQERLRLEKLTNVERLQLEAELQEKLKQQREEQARVGIDFDARQDAINTGEQEDIQAITPEFDPNNIEGSLKALKEFEEQKKIIQLEAQIERFNLERELKVAQGEETLTLDNEIAQKQIELEQLKNAEILKSQEARVKAQQQLEREHLKIAEDLIGGAADLFSDAFAGNLETAEDAQKAFLKLMLDTVEKIVLAQIASASAQSFAQPDSVLTFGASGAARAAVLAALIKAAFSIAKSAILSSEEGNILGQTQGQQTNVNFKRGDVFKGGNHKQGGIKFLLKSLGGNYTLNEAEGGEPILTKKAFKKWPGLISAINEDGGGKKLSSNSDQWRNLLGSLEIKRFNTGDVTGIGPVNSNKIPQLVNPSTVLITQARIPQQDIEDLVETVVESQVNRLIPTIDSIADKVLNGLQESNRLDERLSSAQQNAEV